MDLERLVTEFDREYGARARLFSAPGRVNLIGEHTDYNDGFVLPMAIERRTYVAASTRSDRLIHVRSMNLGQAQLIDLERPGARRRGSWIDYVEGTARALLQRGFALQGANLLIDSDVASGAGLSASAALELSVGYALAVLGGARAPDLVQLALAGQAAEHEYVGMMCGIMDQFVVALGEKDKALLIDCRTLEHKAVPLELGTACVLICDTRVKHELASSEYNTRRAECEAGVKLLAERLPGVRALRDVSVEDFAVHAAALPEPIRRRCRHVVSENARTLAAVRALSSANLAEFGRLMVESHRSLRDDFEVSSVELDLAVDVALAEPGVYGSRMTGGGFGGCTVTLLESASLARVSAALSLGLRQRFGVEAELFGTRAMGGVRSE